jgi:hypothetical protein
MLGSQAETVIGRPTLTDATVHAVVEEHVRRYFFNLAFFFLFFWSVLQHVCYNDVHGMVHELCLLS